MLILKLLMQYNVINLLFGKSYLRACPPTTTKCHIQYSLDEDLKLNIVKLYDVYKSALARAGTQGDDWLLLTNFNDWLMQ
jgi:hypothetical protein